MGKMDVAQPIAADTAIDDPKGLETRGFPETSEIEQEEPEEGLDIALDVILKLLEHCLSSAKIRDEISIALTQLDVQFSAGYLNDCLETIAAEATDFIHEDKSEDGERKRRSYIPRREEVAFLQDMRPRIQDIRDQIGRSALAQRVFRNAKVIAEVFELPEDEEALLYLLGVAHEHPTLSTMLEDFTKNSGVRELALQAMIGADRASMGQIIHGRCRLVRTGLIVIDQDYRGLKDFFELRSSIKQRLIGQGFTAEELRSGLLPRARKPGITIEDAPHMAADADLCIRTLKGAIETGERNVKILLYGPPGTGKTELSRIILEAAGYRAYAIAEDDDGVDLDRETRVAELLMAHSLLGSDARAGCIFDEMEDLTVRKSGEGSKIILNRLLDEAAVPTIFIANDLDLIPDYLLRRMTLAVEVPVPPASVQRGILAGLSEKAGITLSEAEVARLQEAVDVTPAIARSAVNAARLAGGGASDLERAYLSLNRAFTGQSVELGNLGAEKDYRAEFSETDTDLAIYVARLKGRGAIRTSFLFHGLAGTGKSAGARHIARAMGLKVIEKRGSDLLGSYVGQSEKAIRQAFEEARDERAALIFDEIDGLLSDRQGHSQSWETSQVNEFLKALEGHDAPVFGCTNLRDRMDKAAMRRFLFHVEFKALPPQKSAACFSHYLGRPAPAALNDLQGLVPAHFSLVRERCAQLQIDDIAEMMRMLELEARGSNPSRPIGFRAQLRG